MREWMRELRVQKGYTQQALANEIGVTFQCIGAIERGNLPSIRVAQAIGKVLGCDWTQFFDREIKD